MVFSVITQILKNWWWFFLPLIFFYPAKFFYWWWLQWHVWQKKKNFILLELIPPEEIKKPFKAFEDILNVLWGIFYEGPNWRERWCEGIWPAFSHWPTFEIVSFGGEIHFYLRIEDKMKSAVEASFYTYYPEMEIKEVGKDYTEKVPKNIPNETWDLYGEDFTLMRDQVYPFKTYTMFYERPEEEARIMEEKRLDPLNSLLERLSQLQKGEQYWLQIGFAPVTDDMVPEFRPKAEEVIAKLSKRPAPKKKKGFFDWLVAKIIEVFSYPHAPMKMEEEKPPTMAGPEILLTPAEKERLKAVENKNSKALFNCFIRILHIWRKDQPYFAGNFAIGRTYFQHFFHQTLNGIVFFGPTRTKIHYIMRARRVFLRKRKIFKNYILRMPSYFPWNLRGKPIHPFDFGFYPKGPGSWKKGTFVLSSEELATIFHFPAKVTIPAIPTVITKKIGPPPLFSQ